MKVGLFTRISRKLIDETKGDVIDTYLIASFLRNIGNNKEFKVSTYRSRDIITVNELSDDYYVEVTLPNNDQCYIHIFTCGNKSLVFITKNSLAKLVNYFLEHYNKYSIDKFREKARLEDLLVIPKNEGLDKIYLQLIKECNHD